MKIRELFQENKTVMSLEVFPPKKESGLETIYDTLQALGSLAPDFVSITYGAGGSGAAIRHWSWRRPLKNATVSSLCII